MTDVDVHVTVGHSAEGFVGPGNPPPGNTWISDSRTQTVSWAVVMVPVIIVLVGAWSYRWVQEDAFIDFRVVDNLLAGHGPVFNVGERVEVYSDPLWVFLLAGLHEMLPFISLEWLSVFLGLTGTATGVALGGRAIQRLGSRDFDGLVVPVGLILFTVVAGVWEFSTSGLEMGMAFCWIGLSYWLLVRTENLRTSAVGCAFVAGLGSLIRPELALMSLVILAGLAFVAASPGWRGPAGIPRRWLLPLVAAVGVPLAYEVWRMAYFAMFVSNSELAKSGGGTDLPQGVEYLWNFIATYALWAPLALSLPMVITRGLNWWRVGDRVGTVVLATPVVAGIADVLYVTHVGGDYMDARLLLPAFLCFCLVLFVDTSQFRTLMVVPLVGLLAWSAVCLGVLRPSSETIWVHNMHDERLNWIADTRQQHPIDVADYLRLVSLGIALRSKVSSIRSGTQQMLVVQDPGAVFMPNADASTSTYVQKWDRFIGANADRAHAGLPFRLALNVDSIGSLAFLAGPDVYFDDALSLANPIGSHTTIAVRGIPGHEKSVGPEWMIGRFGSPGEQFSQVRIFGLASDTAAARRALNCQPLRSYLEAITRPLTFSQALSNVTHAFTYTTMSFSPDANNAARQLCPG